MLAHIVLTELISILCQSWCDAFGLLKIRLMIFISEIYQFPSSQVVNCHGFGYS